MSATMGYTVATTTAPTTESAVSLDERELRAWRGLLRAHAALTKALDAQLEAEHGLPLSSYEVLLHLTHSPEGRMRMCNLAESVVLSRSGLTRLVDRLEREGYLRREPCADDARGSYAVVTDAGREKLASSRATHLGGVRELFLDHFSEDELETLAAAWDRLLPHLGAPQLPSCS